MKKLLIILIAFIFIGTELLLAKEVKTIKINKNNSVLINLNKNSKIAEGIKSREIDLSLKNNKYLHLRKIDSKIYFHISKINISESGYIVLKVGDKIVEIPYDLEYLKEKENLDLTNDFPFKRIQEKPLSCELSATSDILSYLTGKKISENTLLSELPKSNFNELPYKENGKTIWGNPNKGFVGYIDYYKSNGSINYIKPAQRLMTGYGVYEAPIKEIYGNRGIDSYIVNRSKYNPIFGVNEHLKLIFDELYNGNIVQLWGDWCTDSRFDDGDIIGNTTQTQADKGIFGLNTCSRINQNRTLNWSYYDDNGKLVSHKGLSGEHNFYLLGYIGTPENPNKIIVWDTDTGRHELPINEWLRKWELMDYRSLIIKN